MRLSPGYLGHRHTHPYLGQFAEQRYRQRKRKRGPVVLWHKSDEWETPAEFFSALDREFHFSTDVAALPDNAKCAHFYAPGQNGLKQPWQGVCWMNPPYGPALRQWVKKAFQSAQAGATIVCLLPARTDTYWWHEYVLPHAEIRYLRGRLTFNGAGRATFPSVIVVFRPLFHKGL